MRIGSETGRFGFRSFHYSVAFLLLGTLLTITLTAACFAPDVFAQEAETPVPATMPEGWQTLSPGELMDEADKLFAALNRPTTEHRKEVFLHAWNRFITDPDFVTSADTALLRRVLLRFTVRRDGLDLLIEGSTTVERDASRKTLNEAAAAFSEKVQARLQGDKSVASQSTFTQLKELDMKLRGVGVKYSSRSQMYADWMDANNWQELSLTDKAILYSRMRRDRINHKKLAVRWTGFLKAPVSGSYKLEQLRQYYSDSKIKVWVNNQLVLDSSNVDTSNWNRSTETMQSEATHYLSRPVQLTANENVPIRVELVHHVPQFTYLRGFPMAVLLWQSDQVDRQIIPATAFSPPADFTESGNRGLKGEYFADITFNEEALVETRLDAQLDFIWNLKPAVETYPEKRAAIMNACKPLIMNDIYLASLKGEANNDLINRVAFHFMRAMTATERAAFGKQLMRHPKLWKAVTPRFLTRMTDNLYLLPGKEHLEMITLWSEKTEVPHGSQIGVFPGGRRGTYYHRNSHHYRLMAQYMSGPFVTDSQALCERALSDDQNGCNIHIAKIIANAARLSGNHPFCRQAITNALADDSITGDKRALWLVAKGYADEVIHSGRTHPAKSLPALQQALAVAATAKVRFEILKEIVVRMASLDQSDQAISMMASIAGQFSEGEQLQEIANLQAKATDMRKFYQRRRQQAAEIKSGHHIAELERRLKNAQDKGQSDQVARYQKALQAARANQSSNE